MPDPVPAPPAAPGSGNFSQILNALSAGKQAAGSAAGESKWLDRGANLGTLAGLGYAGTAIPLASQGQYKTAAEHAGGGLALAALPRLAMAAKKGNWFGNLEGAIKSRLPSWLGGSGGASAEEGLATAGEEGAGETGGLSLLLTAAALLGPEAAHLLGGILGKGGGSGAATNQPPTLTEIQKAQLAQAYGLLANQMLASNSAYQGSMSPEVQQLFGPIMNEQALQAASVMAGMAQNPLSSSLLPGSTLPATGPTTTTTTGG